MLVMVGVRTEAHTFRSQVGVYSPSHNHKLDNTKNLARSAAEFGTDVTLLLYECNDRS